MAELKLAVLFEAVDRMSEKIEHISRAFEDLDKAASRSEKMREVAGGITKASLALGAVGGAAALGIGEVVKAAAEEAGVLAHVQTAMDDGAKTQEHLNQLREMSDKLALKGVISTEELGKAYYIARSNALDHAQALEAISAANDLVIGTTANATEAQAAMEETTRTLTELHNNFGGSMQFAADELAKLQTQYAFQNIGEVTEALGFVQATAKNTGVSLTQMNAALATLSENGIHAGSAGETLNQIITRLATGGAHGRLLPFLQRTAAGGLDLQKSFAAVSAAMAHMDDVQRTAFLKGAGFDVRSLRGAEILAAHIGELASVQKDLQSATGAAASAAATRLMAPDEQFEKLTNSIKVLTETIGTAFLPAATKLAQTISGWVTRITAFLDKHPALASMGAEIAGIGTAATLAASGLGLITGGALKIASNVIPAINALGSATGFVVLRVQGLWNVLAESEVVAGVGASLRAMGSAAIEAASSFSVASVATGIWTAMTTALDVVLSPLTLTIGGIIAATFGLAAAVYEIYEHWDGFKAFWVKLWADVKTVFASTEPWMYDAGSRMLEVLGKGILAGIEYPVKAIEHVGKTIMSYLPHSPAEQGPLADLDRVDILGEIARTIEANTDSLTGALGGALGSALGGASRAVHAAAPAISRAWEGAKSLVGAGPAAVLHGLMGVESSFGRMLTTPGSSAIGPYMMNNAFRRAFGVSRAAAMDVTASTEIANKVIFGKYLPEFGGNLAMALSAWHLGEAGARRHGIDTVYVDAVMRHMRLPAMPGAAAATVLAQLPATHGTAVAMPVSAPTGGAAAPRERAAAGSGGFHVHYSPNITINGASGSPEDWRQQMQKHKADLVRVIDDAVNRRSRLKFEMD